MKASEIILNLVKYFSLIHTSKDRIRLRVSPKIKEELKKFENTNLDIDKEISKLNGIKSVKLNKLIGSLTIEYDSEKISENLWLDLLKMQNLQEVKAKIDELERGYFEV